MSKRTQPQSIDWSGLLQEARESFSIEIAGMAVSLLAVLALLSLRASDPWLTHVMGWTALPFALVLLVLGVVMMLHQRAGYWSAEALVGAELVLLCAMTLTYLWQHKSVNWVVPSRGDPMQDGGLVGWATGSLLAASLGRWPAFALMAGLAALGLFLLVRYTPLIYGAHYAGRLFPVLPALLQSVLDWMPRPRARQKDADLYPLAPAASFVAADEAADAALSGPPVTPRKIASKPKSSAKTPTKAKAADGSKQAKPPKPLRTADELPPIDLLQLDSGDYTSADGRALEQLIENTLADFNVPAKIVHVETGPTVTQFGVEPLYLERAGQRRKVRVNRIVALADDLALALAAPAVRIEAPVPGRPYVGIEVPNVDKTMVGLRGILESKEMGQQRGRLTLPLGRDTSGKPVIMDLIRAPHMLIAGQTGAGKSVCINTIICGLLMQHGPESLKFVMVDPKMVELPGYNGIPHLLGKAITDMEQVMGALTYLLLEMDDRYQRFREHGVRNVESYNDLARRRKAMDEMPYIVLIVDELADLMMTAAEDVERQICRLAQMARATGIHLILATQRPSTDVVTGLIKANFPTRIAFAVTSQIDSRVVLDQPGAEKLLGYGDMLLMRPDMAKLTRVQGCWVADSEIEQITGYWKAALPDAKAAVPPWNGLMDRMDDEDELIHEAIDILRDMEACSTSMLQRKLRVGYPKAARLMEDLERKGVVGPDLGGGKGRQVRLKNEEDDDLDEDDLADGEDE